MRFHFASIAVEDSGEAERELNSFLATHRVLGVERHLVPDGPRSRWAICVTYTDAPAAPTARPAPDAHRGCGWTIASA